MLSKPKCGWTTFNLGENEYELSYLTDVANEWINGAIYGLKTLTPFTVYGFLEGWRMICTVSYWNTHIFCEDDENVELDDTKSNYNTVHIKMIDFCQMLYDDINESIDEWAKWYMGEEADMEKNKKRLNDSLSKLKELIEKRQYDFSKNRNFF